MPAAPRYADLDREKLKGIERIADFRETGSRELRADDYIYEIKRLAHPRLHSPIFGMMAEHIVGLKELGKGPCRTPPRAWGATNGWISTSTPQRCREGR